MNISLTEDSSITELYARIESRVVKPTLKRLKSETVSSISYIYIGNLFRIKSYNNIEIISII